MRCGMGGLRADDESKRMADRRGVHPSACEGKEEEPSKGRTLSIERNCARGKAVLEFLELGEALCSEGGYDPGQFWLAVSVGAADRAGLTQVADFLPSKPRREAKPRKGRWSRLTDDDSMPFGKYKKEKARLGDIPSDYFKWFLKQPWCDEWPHLVEYANVICEGDD